jgi:hypothetical protein
MHGFSLLELLFISNFMLVSCAGNTKQTCLGEHDNSFSSMR